MKLPHFHILHHESGAKCHTSTVAGIHQSIGGRGIYPSCASCSQHCGFGFDVTGFTGFHTNRNHAGHRASRVLHEIDSEPFAEDRRARLHIALVERVQ